MCFHALGPKLANLGFDGYAGEARQTLLAPHAQHKPEMEPLSWNVTSQPVALQYTYSRGHTTCCQYHHGTMAAG